MTPSCVTHNFCWTEWSGSQRCNNIAAAVAAYGCPAKFVLSLTALPVCADGILQHSILVSNCRHTVKSDQCQNM